MARRVIADPPFKNITAATDFAHDESVLRHAHGFNKRDSKIKKARTAFAIRAFELLAGYAGLTTSRAPSRTPVSPASSLPGADGQVDRVAGELVEQVVVRQHRDGNEAGA